MKNFKLWGIIVLAILFTWISAIFIVNSSQNKAFSLEEQVQSSQADVTVKEKRRFDLITNLVDCVKQYDIYEAETLSDIVNRRGTIGEVKSQISAVSEAYPELKSNENYKQLMNELSITENMIAQSRENLNNQIKNYNRFIKKFPTRIFLNITGYEKQVYNYIVFEDLTDAPKNLFEGK